MAMRQLIRHRTASVNEESARYSVLASDFYIPQPEHWAINTTADKQATQQGRFTKEQADALYTALMSHNVQSYKLYEALLYDIDSDDDKATNRPHLDGDSAFLSTLAECVPGARP